MDALDQLLGVLRPGDNVVMCDEQPGASCLPGARRGGPLPACPSRPGWHDPFEQQNALGLVGEGLRRNRRERYLSQADLARRTGVSPSAIPQVEAARRAGRAAPRR